MHDYHAVSRQCLQNTLPGYFEKLTNVYPVVAK